MKKKILVVCHGNACRSQIAEGYLRFYTTGQVEVISAGIQADGLHPLAIQVMAEDGIDISRQYSKTVTSLQDQDFHYILTVCDEARQQLPLLEATHKSFHHHFEDPSLVTGSKEAQLEAFHRVREEIKKYVLRMVGREFSEAFLSAA
jgi:arsenate reductase